MAIPSAPNTHFTAFSRTADTYELQISNSTKKDEINVAKRIQ